MPNHKFNPIYIIYLRIIFWVKKMNVMVFRFFFIWVLLIKTSSCNKNYRFNELNEYYRKKNDIKVIQYLNKSKDPYIKVQAAYILGKLKSKTSIPYLLAYLKSKDWELRYYCLISLYQIGWKFSKENPEIKFLIENEENIQILNTLKWIFEKKEKKD